MTRDRYFFFMVTLLVVRKETLTFLFSAKIIIFSAPYRPQMYFHHNDIKWLKKKKCDTFFILKKKTSLGFYWTRKNCIEQKQGHHFLYVPFCNTSIENNIIYSHGVHGIFILHTLLHVNQNSSYRACPWKYYWEFLITVKHSIYTTIFESIKCRSNRGYQIFIWLRY